MLRFLHRMPRTQRVINGYSHGVATAAPNRHPNPSNFANRPQEVLSEIGRRGGKRGGKAKGVGGFHNMDPEKQHAIASEGGRAQKKAAIQLEESLKESKRRSQAAIVPPTFEEWKT
ncbi:hypothetical protein N7450_005925 [Penicillium hetheringtonii]|uniref:Conidiation-specific protein Con-10 n=1 Tax=Penicillium hetheringtonii TaxID=911720 RepID=A0AAD6DJJ0_9EURO|nr:hypothetical protein N7450_005925 [Penicillium hetheringtonii]